MFDKLKERRETAEKIRIAINSLPCGLCFYRDRGQPMLINNNMNETAYRITGKSIFNAETFWEIASEKQIENIVDKGSESENTILVRLDGAVLRIRKEVIKKLGGMEIIQLEMNDVTELYNTVKSYNKANKQLRELYSKMQILLSDVVELNQTKELLHIKSAVHNEFGECITATLQSLDSGNTDTDILDRWESILTKFSNLGEGDTKQEKAPERELIKAAEMIGCKLIFNGRLPADERYKLLLCTAVREALNNAVRHANADIITVDMTETDGIRKADIYSNGNVFPESITEGTGLCGLRKRLGNAGVLLDIECGKKGVILKLTFPKGV